jgi:hypothetical protein
MRDKWRDEDAEAQYECEDESVNLQLYSDHRRGDLDSYPIIAVCDECAAELGEELGGCAGPAAGDILFCEECGISVDNAPDVT